MSNIEPIHRPRPPCPGDPCLDVDNIDQCWRQINALKRIIEDILHEMGGPLKTGPIVGITDGSVALPGRVGEAVEQLVQFPWTGGPQVINLSIAVLQPGDWQVWGQVALDTTDDSDSIHNAYSVLSPTPVGASNVMESFWASAANPMSHLTMDLRVNTMNIKVPTLLAFLISINVTPPKGRSPAGSLSGTGGTGSLHVGARRMR